MKVIFENKFTLKLFVKTGLDLIIFGLTLGIPDGCDFHGQLTAITENCWFLPKYQHRLHITCLFGYDKNSIFQAHPFIITHAGIEVYPKDHKHYNDSKAICDTIGSKGISKTWNERVMPIGVIAYWKTSSEPYVSLDESVCCSNYVRHYLRFYNRIKISENNFEIEREIMELTIWMKDKPNSPKITEFKYLQNIDEKEVPEGGAFTRDAEEWDDRRYYFYIRNTDLTINTSIILYPGRLLDNRREFVIN